jgi:hypothetical protein
LVVFEALRVVVVVAAFLEDVVIVGAIFVM